MLQFIVGCAASGKTYETLNRAAECVRSGKEPVILVPEQFTFECEKQVLLSFGDALAQKIKVLSFSRICDEVNRLTGGVCDTALSEADRLIMMKKAVKNVAGELSMFAKYVSSNGFAERMNETVQEFKLNAVSADDLLRISDMIAEASLSEKLRETAVIMNSYDAVVSEHYIDPSDRLSLLYTKLENCRFFENKTVFIDSFDGFTGQQYKILDRIFSQSSDITVTLDIVPGYESKYGVFSGIAKLKRRLSDMAKSHSVKVNEDIKLQNSRFESSGLYSVEKYLRSGGAVKSGDITGVTVCEALTVYDEAEFVARTIRKTVRENGARYRDFLIVARDTDPYSSALSFAMKKNGIPLFSDSRSSLSQAPVAAVVSAAAELMKGINSERILRLYKSGLSVFSNEELGTLENYVYVWNIDRNSWLDEWDMNPDGFVTGEPDCEKLKEINDLRLRAVKPVSGLIHFSGETARDMVLEIMKFLDKTDAQKGFLSLFKEYKESGKTALGEMLRQSYDAVISVFDSIVTCYGEERIKVSEFCDALNSALSLETVGTVPQSLDEVTFGAADRIRPARPEYVFIVGANQGVFPRGITSSGVFSAADRERIIELGIDIPDRAVFDAVNEEFLIYSNLCSAKKSLYISYAKTLSDGSEGESSAFLSDMCTSFGITPIKEPDALCENNLPETEESALSDFCRRYSSNIDSASDIYRSLSEDTVQKADVIASFAKRPVFTLKPENAEKLLGDTLWMSPSKFDNFSKCRFMYFCKNVLGIDILQKNEFNAMQRGTLIHHVLQRVVETKGKSLADASEKEIKNLVRVFMNEYLDSVTGYRSVEDSRLKYITESMARNLDLVVGHMAEEFKNSDFEPVGCEVSISADGDLPEIRVPLENGKNLVLTGIIDRLDRYNGYVRIVDYKSGHREFKLPDILCGQNMQMLMYLYAVCRDEKHGGEPAGIFYMPAKYGKNIADKDRRMNGLMIRNGDVNLAMDRSGSGKFVPPDNRYNMNSYIEEGNFQKIFDFTSRHLKASGKSIYGGKIYADPIDGLDSEACKYCPFGCVCRIEDNDIRKAEKISNDDVFERMERWDEKDDQRN